MPITPSRMPFFDHIAELRRRIIIVAVTIIVGSMVLYTWGWDIFNFIMAPHHSAARRARSGRYSPRSASSACGSRWRSTPRSSSAGPIIIWQVMAFFLPALKPKERRYVVPTFIALVVLFIAGVTFCYIDHPGARRSRGSSRRVRDTSVSRRTPASTSTASS